MGRTKKKIIRKYIKKSIDYNIYDDIKEPIVYIKLEKYVDNMLIYGDKSFINTLSTFRIYKPKSDKIDYEFLKQINKPNYTYDFINQLFNFDRFNLNFIYLNNDTILKYIIVSGLYDDFEILLSDIKINYDKSESQNENENEKIVECKIRKKEIFDKPNKKKGHLQKLNIKDNPVIENFINTFINTPFISKMIYDDENDKKKDKLINDLIKFLFYTVCIKPKTRQYIMRHYLLSFIKSPIFQDYKDKIMFENTTSKRKKKIINNFLVNIGKFEIIPYGNEHFKKNDGKEYLFTSCGEITILNLLNYFFIKDNGSFYINNSYSKPLKNFYTKYNIMSKQTENIKKTSRDWFKVVSNLKKDNDDGIELYNTTGDINNNIKNINYVLKTILKSNEDDIINILKDISSDHEIEKRNTFNGVELLLDKKIDVFFRPGHGEMIFHDYNKQQINNIDFDDNDCKILYTNIFSKINYTDDYEFQLVKVIMKVENKENYIIKDFFSCMTHISLDYRFNEPLKHSLDNFINLTNLTFGYFFDKPLGHSLDNLIHLKHLTFKNNFNEPLKQSLDNLKNLIELNLGAYDQPLGNSLDNLEKLKYIIVRSSHVKEILNIRDKNKLKNLKEISTENGKIDLSVKNSCLIL